MTKILKSAKCCAKIAVQNILSWAQNYRMIMLLLLLFVNLAQYCTRLNTYSEDLGTKINGFGILPMLYNVNNGFSIRLIIQLGIVLMFSNAPFKNNDSLFCVMRTGYARWCVGELIYIVSASFIYTVSLFLITNILCVKNLTYSLKWGKTFSSMQMSDAFVYRSPDRISMQYKPLEALLHTMLLIFLLSVFFGLLIFLMSSLIGRSSGVILASAFVMLGLMPGGFTEIPQLASKLSPCSFTQLGLVDKLGISRYPSLAYAYTAFIILIIALLSANIVIYSNKKIRHNIYASEV